MITPRIHEDEGVPAPCACWSQSQRSRTLQSLTTAMSSPVPPVASNARPQSEAHDPERVLRYNSFLRLMLEACFGLSMSVSHWRSVPLEECVGRTRAALCREHKRDGLAELRHSRRLRSAALLRPVRTLESRDL